MVMAIPSEKSGINCPSTTNMRFDSCLRIGWLGRSSNFFCNFYDFVKNFPLVVRPTLFSYA